MEIDEIRYAVRDEDGYLVEVDLNNELALLDDFLVQRGHDFFESVSDTDVWNRIAGNLSDGKKRPDE
jgi:hypothetical protein